MIGFAWYRFEGVWSAWGEANVFLIPVLAGALLLAWRPPADRGGTRFYFLALLAAAGWRIAYAWAMKGGTRYQLLPVILAVPLVVGGLCLPRRVFASRRTAAAASLLLAAAMTAVAVVKDLRPPKSDKRAPVEAVASLLLAEKAPGIVLDDSSFSTRLMREVPEFEIVPEHHLQPGDLRFWRRLQDFIRRRQVEGKALYLLLQTPRGGGGAEEFRLGCRREWGGVPFVSLLTLEDRNSRYELFRYRPPRLLFDLECSTPARPNPAGPFLPREIRLRRGEPFTLEFRRIVTDARYFQWGGVEVDVRFGEADDLAWRFTPGEGTPERFPLSITLYAPNGWPTGYAASTVRVVDGATGVLPAPPPPGRERAIDWSAKPADWRRTLPTPASVPGTSEVPAPCLDELGNLPGDRGANAAAPAVRMREKQALRGELFWIGSRVWGTSRITGELEKANPKLRIFRLEEHPELPYSRDPRYTFAGLAQPRPPVNPLLGEDGKIDWAGYLRRQGLPSFGRIVLALGYEETMWQAGRTAFHIDAAELALRRFLDAVGRAAPECRVLLILPGMPSLRQRDYAPLTANPYLYGFRWGRRHSYRRLVEAAFRVAEEYPRLAVLPTYLWLPAGSGEGHPLYRKIIELYLQELEENAGNDGGKS